jgi:hypothetical protein
MENDAESLGTPSLWSEYWRGALVLSLFFAGVVLFVSDAKSPQMAGLLFALILF